ncbi:MAG: aminoacyl-tRNA hydrolase [Desulfuromonadaceae bacterium]
MKIVVGLGNPGTKYADTRHNVGFMVVDALAHAARMPLKKKGHQARYAVGRLAGEEAMLVLPQTFMNLSGASIASACKASGASGSDVVVIHDDIDLPFGVVRIKVGGGHGGHNGLRHIIQLVGNDFIRIRIGVDRPPAGGDAAAFVLRAFSADEKNNLNKVLAHAVSAVETVLQAGAQQAMCEFNGQDVLSA